MSFFIFFKGKICCIRNKYVFENIYQAFKKIFIFFFRSILKFKIKKIDEMGVVKAKRNVKLIVSLTSYPNRISILPYTVYSLLNQTIKPDEIILWLEKEKFPRKEDDIPEKLLNLKRFGLSIKWCDELRSYCKLIPTLYEYPNDIIITCDDDIYYPSKWLEILYKEYGKDNKNIICHRVHKITFNKYGGLMPYQNWVGESNDGSIAFNNFLTGVGGVLYPPNSLHPDVMNMNLAKKLSPLADDIWFWGMAVLNGTKIKSLDNGINKPISLNAFEKGINNDTLASQNVVLGKNDEQLEALLNYYPKILSNLQGI